ncbi:hypothetical protein GCM10010149_06740 [Nonomuraea roseoviolacea subsp. roseoviolacea]|uniref:hypothetical protein n=1 Tax=Nonomuraea roseoviolacea TaxID=103837 RepID=UPI0031D97150
MKAAGTPLSAAGRLARKLAAQLDDRGIDSQISECEGIALVGIWSVGLAVWCEWGPQGWRFRWCVNETTYRGTWRYTSCPASAVETATARIVRLHDERYERMHGANTRQAPR